MFFALVEVGEVVERGEEAVAFIITFTRTILLGKMTCIMRI
jgi:hypothetical protein